MNQVPENTIRRVNSIYVAIAIAIILLAFTVILKFNGLYGQDGYQYLSYEKGLYSLFHGGIKPSDMFFPMYYSLFGSILNWIIPDSVLCLQLVSIIAFSLSYIYIENTIRLIYREANKLEVNTYLLLFYFLSPYVFRFSVLVMSDMLALLFCVGCFYHVFKYLNNSKTTDFAMMFFMAMAAVLTRNACIALVFLPVIITAWTSLKKLKYIQWITAISVIAICLLPDYYIRHKLFVFGTDMVSSQHQYFRIHPVWSVSNFFKSKFHTIDEYYNYPQPNIIEVCYNFFHPAWLFVGVVFCFFIRKKDFGNKFAVISVASVLMYAIFLAGFDFQNMRNLLVSFPLVLVFFYPAFEKINKRISWMPARYFAFNLVLFFQIAFTGYSFANVYRQGGKNYSILQ